MKTRKSRSRAARFAAALIAAPVAVLPMVLAPPASAAWIVYDPTNYAQNVLQAALANYQAVLENEVVANAPPPPAVAPSSSEALP